MFHGDWIHLNADGSVIVDEDIEPASFEWTIPTEEGVGDQWTDDDSLGFRVLPGPVLRRG